MLLKMQIFITMTFCQNLVYRLVSVSAPCLTFLQMQVILQKLYMSQMILGELLTVFGLL